MDVFRIIYRLYLPLMIFIISLVLIFAIKETVKDDIIISFGYVSFPLPIKNEIVAKGILCILSSLTIFFYYLFFDFSKMFPEKFELQVTFNNRTEIKTMIEDFGITKIDGFKIVEIEDKNYAQYFESADNEIQNIFDYKNYYYDVFCNDTFIETTGKATFIVEKTGGIHNYRIIESEGIINHQKSNSIESNIEEWNSKFIKVYSPNDVISIKNISDLFGKIILTPKFNQSVVINGRGETKFKHTLYGVSYIRPLPYPRFSGTIYLFKKEDQLIPIGYAINISK